MKCNRAVLAMVIIMTLLIIQLPVAYADGIVLDGVIDESDWEWWFKDESQPPVVDVYWYVDSENLYIGLLTDDANENQDVLEFAFRGMRWDYLVEIKSDGSARYRRSGGDYQGWWRGIQSGFSPGVDAVVGTTNGTRSYEMSISLTVLGDVGGLPEGFVFWFKVLDGSPDGPANYYPNSRADCFFVPEEEDDGEDEFVPSFHVPELPLGTVMAVISMFAAIALYMRKPSFLPSNK